MIVYERILENLETAQPQEIKSWILQRASGRESEKLDYGLDTSQLSTSVLLSNLHESADTELQHKLSVAILLSFHEAFDLHLYGALKEVVTAIHKIELQFPFKVVIDFLLENATHQNFRGLKTVMMSLLQDWADQSELVAHTFKEWYWSNPVTVGREFSTQLFVGLVSENPTQFPELLLRLRKINNGLIELNYQMPTVWAAILDNCSQEMLQEGLQKLPPELAEQYYRLHEINPEFFSAYDNVQDHVQGD